MKKIINKTKYLFFSFFVAALFTKESFAACTNGRLPDPFNPNCEGNPPTIGDIVGRFLPIIPVAIGLVLFGVLVWGGFQVFTAGANDDAKKKGFQTIQNAITGVIILLFSVAIITILEAVLGTKILFGVFVK